MEQQQNKRLFEFIEAEAARLFKKVYEMDYTSKEDAQKMATILSTDPDFESLKSKVRNKQTECIQDHPEALPLWTDMFREINELIFFSETYYNNLKYMKEPELAFENTYDYFFISGKRPKPTSSKI